MVNTIANMPNPFANGGKSYRPITQSSRLPTKPLGTTQNIVRNAVRTRNAPSVGSVVKPGQMPYISTDQFDKSGALNPIWSARKVDDTTFYDKDQGLANYVNEYNDLVKRAKMGSPLSNEEQRRMMDLQRLINGYQKAPNRA